MYRHSYSLGIIVMSDLAILSIKRHPFPFADLLSSLASVMKFVGHRERRAFLSVSLMCCFSLRGGPSSCSVQLGSSCYYLLNLCF